MTAAIGLRVKSGWAAVVLLGGPAKSPRLLDSRTIELSDPALPGSRQPYHVGFGTAQSDTSAVDRLVRAIEQFSHRSIAALVAEYGESRVHHAGIVVPSLTDPATIANQHMRAHASEGKLFRTVVVDGLDRCGLKSLVVREREVYDRLAKALRRTPASVKASVTSLGKETKPWRAEQKVAAAAAWLVLAQ